MLVVGTMGKYGTMKEKHRNNENDLEQYLSQHYKDNYLIFNFSYPFFYNEFTLGLLKRPIRHSLAKSLTSTWRICHWT